MNTKNGGIIVLACLVTAVLVSVEVYFWQGGTLRQMIPGLSASHTPFSNNGVPPVVKPNTNYDEIKTKGEGIAVCEQNAAYSKTAADAEQKQMALAIVDYCYAIIAGKFNDLSLCRRALDKNNCEKTAQDFIEMGQEMEKMSPEEKEQLQKLYKNMYQTQ